MLAKTVAVFLLAFTLQTEALPSKTQDNSSLNKLISRAGDVFSAEKLISFVGDHQDVIEELAPSVVSTIYKMATCKTGATSIVLPHIADVMACINITISVYDTEIILYQAFQFGLEVYDNTLGLVSDILACRSESNVFDIIDCALNTVETRSVLFKEMLNRTSQLVLEFEDDYDGLTVNLKKCEGLNSTALFTVWDSINRHC